MEDNKIAKRIGSAIKFILTAALFIFIGAFVFRMCQSSYKGLEDTIATPALREAYQASDEIRTHAVNDEFSENGAVYAYSLVYIEESGYLQLSVRYNKRHIDEVILSYPDFKESDISYLLVDDSGNTYKPTVIDELEKYNYHYFRLEFTGVDFSAKSLSIKMILEGIDINVGEKSTLTVHRKDDTYIPFTLTEEMKNQLN
jgi:hypothetical protein